MERVDHSIPPCLPPLPQPKASCHSLGDADRTQREADRLLTSFTSAACFGDTDPYSLKWFEDDFGEMGLLVWSFESISA